MTAESGRSPSPDAVLWVHGMQARSFEQVAGYLTGDAHDQSKVQVYVGGQFYDVVIAPASTPSPGPAS